LNLHAKVRIITIRISGKNEKLLFSYERQVEIIVSLCSVFRKFFQIFFAGSEKSSNFVARELASAPQFLSAMVYSGSIPERFTEKDEGEV
jgi:hypothetical protein